MARSRNLAAISVAEAFGPAFIVIGPLTTTDVDVLVLEPPTPPMPPQFLE